MKPMHTRRLVGAMTLLAAAALTAACDRNDDGRTTGQKLDAAMAGAERKGEQAAAEVRSASKELGKEIGKASDQTMDKVKDAAITSAINAKLVADSRLSALRIDVDTVGGHVTLNGSAPDNASKDYATTLASRVDGVVAVDNRLVVAPKSDGRG